LSVDEINRGPVAIPGRLTTANLLFSLCYPEAVNKRVMLFSEIESAVLDGSVIAGVIIHENRFTYAQKGLVKVIDLGEYWESETGCPIPLGAIAVRRSLGDGVFSRVEDLVRQSVQYAFDHPEISAPYVNTHAQEMDPEVIKAHIHTYVNAYSLDIGYQGLEAIQALETRFLATAGI
jgi:1,4-dihydroxy-6-naphthoate synthase